MISTLFFILAIILGVLLLYLLRIKIFLEEKIAWGLIFGVLVLTFLSFILAFFFGFTWIIILLAFLSAILIIGILSFRYRKDISQRITYDLELLKKRFKTKKLTVFSIVFVLAVLFSSILWTKVFFEKEEGIFTIAVGGVWGDWAAHNAYVSHFAYSDSLSFEHPIFLGERFSYTFMADFLSALLMKLGEVRILAMIIPGFFFSIALIILLYYFVFRITKKVSISALSIFLYLFGGGLGFLYFFKEINGMNLSEIIDFLRKSHTAFTHLAEHNIHWTNFIQALLLPQRALTMGFPIGVLVLTCILIALKRRNNYKLLLLAGIISSFLPTIHAHSLIAVSIVAFFLIIFLSEGGLKNTIKKLLAFFGPVLVLGVWQLLLLFPVGKESFKFYIGWMAKEENWLLFWLKNLGVFFILIPFAIAVLKPDLKKIYLAFFTLFILTNFFLFQPHDYDNIKIATYWFLLTSIIISIFLVKLWQKDILAKTLVVTLIFFMVFSSFLDVFHLYTKEGYLIFSKEEVKTAKIIREKTSPDSIFLTSDQHNHYLPCLTGRQILMGYGGWLWTYGIDFGNRQKDISTMFQGKPGVKELLKKYKVDYVVIGPSEKDRFDAKESFYDQNYPLFLQINNNKIYKIR